MKGRLPILALTALALMAFSRIVSMGSPPALAGGATQISGIGFLPDLMNVPTLRVSMPTLLSN